MKVLRPSLLIMGLFVLGGIIFKLTTPDQCTEIMPNDSIFVLTGDFRRIPFAMKKIEQYPDTDLYIIGVAPESAYRNTKRAIIESESRSTYQNAIAIRNIVKNAGLDRIVLITTEDHMTRSKHLVQSELPTVDIIACPAKLSEMPATRRLERWIIEYMKYIATLIGVKEGPQES